MSSRSQPTTDSLPIVCDSFEGYGAPRAFACVVRRRAHAMELLVFELPEAGTQIPKGADRTGRDVSRGRRARARRGIRPGTGADTIHRTHRREFEHPADGSTVSEDWHLWRSRHRPGWARPGCTDRKRKTCRSPIAGWPWTTRTPAASTLISPRRRPGPTEPGRLCLAQETRVHMAALRSASTLALVSDRTNVW
jgi:hypothetical protein